MIQLVEALVAFGAGVMLLTRRAESRRAQRFLHRYDQLTDPAERAALMERFRRGHRRP